MSEGQLLLMFCLVYSGALSMVIWANLVVQERVRVHLAESEADSGAPDPDKQSA